MTEETNDARLKPDPPDPWRVLGWRFAGCLVVTPLLWLWDRLLPDMALTRTIYLPLALWLFCLVAFCRDRFWHDSRPLWGRLALAGPGWTRYALRWSLAFLTIALGLPVFLLVFSIFAIPFAAGHAPL